MSIKSIFFTLYLLTGLVFTSFAWHFGYPADAHMGFAYVLGANIFTWPFSSNFYLILRIIGALFVLAIPLYLLAKSDGDASDD